MPSLPPRVVALVRMVGTVQHPGQAVRYHLPQGVAIEPEIRREADHLVESLSSTLDPESSFGGRSAAEARIGIVTKLLIGSAMGAASAESADAKLDLYETSLHDVPAWAVAAAMERWVRGECPPQIDPRPNYDFAPGPAKLRALALLELGPFQSSLAAAKKLARAVTFEEAMDSAPPAPSAAPQGLQIGMRRM